MNVILILLALTLAMGVGLFWFLDDIVNALGMQKTIIRPPSLCERVMRWKDNTEVRVLRGDNPTRIGVWKDNKLVFFKNASKRAQWAKKTPFTATVTNRDRELASCGILDPNAVSS